MKQQFDSAINDGTLGSSLLQNDGIGPLISAETTLLPKNPQDQAVEDEGGLSTTLIIVIAAVSAGLLVTIVIILCLKRKSAKVENTEEIIPSFSAPISTVSKPTSFKEENITEENISEVVFEKQV